MNELEGKNVDKLDVIGDTKRGSACIR